MSSRKTRPADSRDRAFRALARAEPSLILAFLAATLPGLVPPGKRVTPEHVDDPHLDSAAHQLDADFLARLGRRDLLHLEFQGYRETAFLDRLFRYHLASVERYRGRRVRSVAIWLIRPPERQRRENVVVGDVSVRVHAVILPDVPARRLLADPKLACFAAGADQGTWSTRELCERVVQAMRRTGATVNQWRVAGVVAMAKGRYKEMVSAMQRTKVEPAIVIEFEVYGRERYRRGLQRGRKKGVEQGLQQGIEQGLQQGIEQVRQALFTTLGARSIAIGPADRERISSESSFELLLQWVQRAVTARSAAKVFGS